MSLPNTRFEMIVGFRWSRSFELRKESASHSFLMFGHFTAAILSLPPSCFQGLHRITCWMWSVEHA